MDSQPLSTFSDLKFEHPEVVAEDERVVVLATMTGTHTGTAHKRFQQRQFHLFRMRAGKIVKHSALRDDLGLLHQLGVFAAVHCNAGKKARLGGPFNKAHQGKPHHAKGVP